jgi:hypothetical protein
MDVVAAELALARLQRAYADVSTRKAWAEFAGLVTPDVHLTFDIGGAEPIEAVGPETFMAFSAQMTDRFSFYEYVPLNFVVEVAPDGSARGRSYSFEIGADVVTGELTTFFGMYHDDYVIFDDTWRFSRRRYQTLARRSGNDAMASFPLKARSV